MMTKRQLGRTGPVVSAIGFGCAGLSTGRGPATIFCASSRAQRIALVRAARDFGVSFFDAGASCGPQDHNEALLGEAIAPFRNHVAVATRFGLDSQGRPAQIRHAVDASLARLGTEAIDLFCLQHAEPLPPIEDMAGTVQDLIREGKVKHFGLCEPGVATLRRAHAVQRVSVVLAGYSLWDRAVEHTLLPSLEELGIGLMAQSPLGGGALHGNLTLAALAERRHATVAQLALAWLLAQKPWIVPVPGTRRIGHLDENLGGADLRLSGDDLRQIGAALAATQTPQLEVIGR